MYRFLLRPSWLLLHVTVVAAIASMINLGVWQFQRHQERADFNEIVSARIDSQPKNLGNLLADLKSGKTTASELEWQNILVIGRYLDDQTLLVVNRSQGGISGIDPLTPLLIDDASIDQVVMVNRGFMSQSAVVPSAPVGEIQIIARLRISETRRFGKISDPATGNLKEIVNIDLIRLSQQISSLNTDIYLEVLESQPSESTTLTRIEAPELSAGSHLSYTAQWFIFSVFVAAGWVVVVRRKLKSL